MINNCKLAKKISQKIVKKSVHFGLFWHKNVISPTMTNFQDVCHLNSNDSTIIRGYILIMLWGHPEITSSFGGGGCPKDDGGEGVPKDDVIPDYSPWGIFFVCL